MTFHLSKCPVLYSE